MRRRYFVPLLLAVWTIPGVLAASLTAAFVPAAVLRANYGAHFGLTSYYIASITPWWVWVPLTPLVVGIVRRYPLERDQLRRALPAHLVAALFATAIYVAGYAATSGALRPDSEPPEPFLRLFRGYLSSRLPIGILVYAAVAGATIAIDERARRRQRELQAVRLEAELSRAQLQALQMQLQPHFLFNTLHAVSILVQESPAAASRMITQLGELLRQTLALADVPEITLREELDILGRYLEIEETRFGDQLRVTVDVSDEALDIPVPSLLLQPLVENAIRHGVAPRVEAGSVTLRAHVRDRRLMVEVKDDGPGFGGGPPRDTGLGLTSTRERLAVRYGAAARLRCENAPGGGAQVTIELPVSNG